MPLDEDLPVEVLFGCCYLNLQNPTNDFRFQVNQLAEVKQVDQILHLPTSKDGVVVVDEPEMLLTEVKLSKEPFRRHFLRFGESRKLAYR